MTEMTSAQAAQRIFLLRQAIKDMETEVKELTQVFTEREYDTYAEGDFKVVVQRNARFDAATAKANLSEEEYTSILSLLPDSKKAKETLAPIVYAQTQKESAPKVTVTLPKEEN